MADYSRAGPVFALASGAVAPLVISLAPHSLITLGAGGMLVVSLVWMTFADGAVAKNAKHIEAKALEDVVMTSTGNRFVRIALGSVYAYAAVAFVLRWANADILERLLSKDLMAVGQTAVAWNVCLVDGYFAGLWLSSGSDGQ